MSYRHQLEADVRVHFCIDGIYGAEVIRVCGAGSKMPEQAGFDWGYITFRKLAAERQFTWGCVYKVEVLP